MNATRRLERALDQRQELLDLEVRIRAMRIAADQEVVRARAQAASQPFTDTEIELLVARLENPASAMSAIDDAIRALRAHLPASVRTPVVPVLVPLLAGTVAPGCL